MNDIRLFYYFCFMKKLLHKIWQKLNFWEYLYDNDSDNETLADIIVFVTMGV